MKARLTDVSLSPGEIKSLTFSSAQLGQHFKVTDSSEVWLGDSPKELRVELNGLSINHPWVSPEPVTFPQVSGTLTQTLNWVGFLRVGPASLMVWPEQFHVEATNSCNDWVDAMPIPLPPALEQARGHFKGDLGFVVQKNPTPLLKFRSSCKFDCSAEPIHSLRQGLWKTHGQYTYRAYDSHNQLFDRKVGPAVDWAYLANLSPQVPKAFITMEDPSFEFHNGIVSLALQNSFQQNLQLGKFFRGGSTISMQLAKNLWLRRHKTLGRKAQEVLLTSALESCLSKAEILELYLNVVEFGPDIYGLRAAAKRYFDKEPEELDTEEAFYLASILPRPRKAIPPQQGGMRYIPALMKNLAENGLISEQLVPVAQIDDSGWETD